MVSEKELADTMSQAVNHGINSEELQNLLGVEHRHLQSEVYKQILKPLICEFARKEQESDYDKRNERAVKECREIADAMNWKY